MKRILILSVFSALVQHVAAQNVFEKEPYLSQSLSSESIQFAEVATSGGSLHVTAVSQSEAKLEMYVIPNNSISISREEIKKRLEEDYVITIKVSQGKLTANARRKSNDWNWKKSLNISFKLYVPAKINTDLATSGGSIHIKGLDGNQEFKTSGGSLHAEDCKGILDGATSGGSIHVSGCNSKVKMATSGGSIHASNCIGEMDLATSGGSIDLDNLDGDIEAVTSGGSINADNIKGALNTATSGGSVRLKGMRCDIDAATSGGGVSVEVVEVGKYIKLRNSSGSIDLTLPRSKGYDLDLKAQKINADLKNFSGTIITENQIKGLLNGGGVLVDVKASSGKINIDFN